MKKTLLIVALAFALVLAGCAQQSPGNGNVTQQGSANYQRCVSQCGVGNAGNGTLCQDGCRVQEAADTKSVSMCSYLVDQSNFASCYGTVAKASGDITVCNGLTNATQKQLCISVFGSPSTG
jgi:hypothetical protein